MRHWSRALALAAVLAMVLAACGGNGTTETTAAPASSSTTAMSETTTGGSTATTMAPGGEIKTDHGVDIEAGTINVGLLSDLSGPFAPLVSAIVSGHEVYWENVNNNGGINGLKVNLVIEDNAYDVPTQIQKYEKIHNDVVAIGHSTGSPHTVAILPNLAEDNMLAIPLTWYSGWTDPALNANLLHHGSPYCLEAMNSIDYMSNDIGGASTIAIASIPGDYGLDGATGAAKAAEALGLEVVYDATGKAIPGDDASLTEIANGIAAASPDLVFFSATPAAFSSVFGQAVAQGYEGKWTGTSPSWSPAFMQSEIADAVTRDVYISTYVDTWDGDSEGSQDMTALMKELKPDAPPLDYYNEGYVEATILHQALLKAYDNGDMTRAGVLAAGKSLESVDFKGLAAPETYVGAPNEQVQRKTNMARPDPNSPTGSSITEFDYTAQITADYQFDGACYKLEQ